MAYYDKEAYEAKQRYADNRNKRNSEVAMLNGMTKEQAAVVTWLCEVRHYIHCNYSDAFNDEADTDVMDYIYDGKIAQIQDFDDYGDTCIFHGENTLINTALVLAGFDKIEFIDNTQWEFLPTSLTYEYDDLTEDEARVVFDEAFESLDSEIIKYLQQIDEKYKSSFAPTGYGRLEEKYR